MKKSSASLSVKCDVFIKAEKKPEYLKTLTLAVKHEEENLSKEYYLGWEWFNVETHPAKLIRLVTEGIAQVRFKSNSSTHYLLKDRDSVKKILARIEKK
ncbi:MAG: hypothetical protein ACREAF_04990 [Nitrosopumilaceae archaeon]